MEKMDQNGYDPLHIAAKQGNFNVLKELLKVFPELAMTMDLSNTTTLHTVASQGHLEVVNRLLEVDKSLTKITRSNGKTALHSATRNGHLEVVKALLDNDSGIACKHEYTRDLHSNLKYCGDVIFAGLTVLDIVQASPPMSPISSKELFSVLDEASEKTSLCVGITLPLQKYVFDGEAVKKPLEIKNTVACTSFLIEIELVKAWLVGKDAEAHRSQKLLVDEWRKKIVVDIVTGAAFWRRVLVIEGAHFSPRRDIRITRIYIGHTGRGPVRALYL